LWKWMWQSTDHGTADRAAFAGADNTPSGTDYPNYSAKRCPDRSTRLYACTVSPAVW
jgi:hypothetical protein